MVTKIKQIFKQAVLRFWSLRVPLIVVCILLAALLCTAQYQDSSRVASAQMTLNYSEASQGLNPNRTRFTTTDLTSDEVLQSTLYNAGLEGQMTVEQLRKAITVEPTDVTNVSSSENYITTSCSISRSWKNPPAPDRSHAAPDLLRQLQGLFHGALRREPERVLLHHAGLL